MEHRESTAFTVFICAVMFFALIGAGTVCKFVIDMACFAMGAQ